MGYKTYTCPIAKECGGCEWLAVPYPIQLRRKNEFVSKLFSLMLAEDKAQLEDIVGMEEPLGYRCKAATPFAPGRKHRIKSGFYSHGSHHIVACDNCLVEHPSLRPLLNSVAYAAQELGISAYNEDSGRGLLRHAVARVGCYSKEILLTVVTNGQGFKHTDAFVRLLQGTNKQLVGIVQNVNQKQTNAILGSENHCLWGKPYLHDSLLTCNFEFGPSSFYQTNPLQTETLYTLAFEMAEMESSMRVLDAYCGVGTIGITAAASYGIELVGVELVREAVQHARTNAKANGVEKRCRFVCADVSSWIVEAARSGEHFDVVILDPPRAGTSPEFLQSVCVLAPKKVVYISCNPLTQERDVNLLRAHGYKLLKLTSVDMFPHTKHVECVALMSRTGG